MLSLRSAISVLAAAVAATAAVTPAASAAPVREYLGRSADRSGDAPSLNRDIIDSIARYKDDGSILFVVTVAAPIDPAAADAAVNVSLGTSCNKLLGLGVGLLSDPSKVAFIPVSKRKKLAKARVGAGKITSNVFTFLVKNPALAGWAPTCYAIALVDPKAHKGEVPVPYDQTGEIPLKRKG